MEQRGDSVDKIEERILAVVVTYHPDSGFPERLAHISAQVDGVVIVDNTPGGPDCNSIDTLADKDKVSIIQNGFNKGGAVALNQGLEYAQSRGYTLAVLFDQDSKPDVNSVRTLLAIYNVQREPERVAVVGTPFRQAGIITGSSPENLSGWSFEKTVITSGSLIPLKTYECIGSFREDFFIDCVDLEYCLRAKRMGFSVLQSTEVLMEHSLGDPTRHCLPWRTYGTTNHPAWRRYYIARNTMVLVKEYALRDPCWTAGALVNFFKSTCLMVLFEHGRFEKIKSTALGILDGLVSNCSRNIAPNCTDVVSHT